MPLSTQHKRVSKNRGSISCDVETSGACANHAISICRRRVVTIRIKLGKGVDYLSG